jgi:hypothetical protein
VIVDETYANGDGTDSWCGTNIPILNSQMYGGAYEEPTCSKWSCYVIDLRGGYGGTIQKIDETISPACGNRDYSFNYGFYLLCMQ